MLFCKIYPVIKIRELSFNFVFIINNLSLQQTRICQGLEFDITKVVFAEFEWVK